MTANLVLESMWVEAFSAWLDEDDDSPAKAELDAQMQRLSAMSAPTPAALHQAEMVRMNAYAALVATVREAKRAAELLKQMGIASDELVDDVEAVIDMWKLSLGQQQ